MVDMGELGRLGDGQEEALSWSGIRSFAKSCVRRTPFVQQRFNWDCGLSCVQMILRSKFPQLVSDDVTQKMDSFSLWSIDLAYIIASFEVPVVYFTTTNGVHPDYVNLDFYNREIAADRERVERKFREASRTGVRVEQRSLFPRELGKEVGENQKLVIVLVDVRLLRCLLCEGAGEAPVRSSPQFRGHYILLCGYDPVADVYAAKDPSRPREICIVRSSVLHEARTAFGTDEDVIIVN